MNNGCNENDCNYVITTLKRKVIFNVVLRCLYSLLKEYRVGRIMDNTNMLVFSVHSEK